MNTSASVKGNGIASSQFYLCQAVSVLSGASDGPNRFAQIVSNSCLSSESVEKQRLILEAMIDCGRGCTGVVGGREADTATMRSRSSVNRFVQPVTPALAEFNLWVAVLACAIDDLSGARQATGDMRRDSLQWFNSRSTS